MKISTGLQDAIETEARDYFDAVMKEWGEVVAAFNARPSNGTAFHLRVVAKKLRGLHLMDETHLQAVTDIADNYI